MGQSQAVHKKDSPQIIKLRVVNQRYMEAESRDGKLKMVAAPWEHTIRHDGKSYTAGSLMSVPRETAQALLETGGVQLASEEPKPFMPPNLEHRIQMSNGVQLRGDLLGKHPTREGEGDKNAPWEDDQDDD